MLSVRPAFGRMKAEVVKSKTNELPQQPNSHSVLHPIFFTDPTIATPPLNSADYPKQGKFVQGQFFVNQPATGDFFKITKNNAKIPL